MSSNNRRVVIDLDVGTDDAFALLVLLHAEKLNHVKVEAIVCSMGNASLDNVCKNVVRLLELFGRTDIPVYKGVKEPIIPYEGSIAQFHGKDGFGDLNHETDPDITIVSEVPAAIAMHDLVINNPKEISLVCVGPLTNVALSMKLFADFAENVKDIFIMGGNYAAIGNITETAEYNFYMDPEGAFIVLGNAKCPVTIATWETCLNTNITLEWRFNDLGLLSTPFIQLLNKVEQEIYGPEIDFNSIWYPCDALLVIAMLYPESAIETISKHYATVELHGSKTRGQIVLDHLKKKAPNVAVIEKINSDFVKNILLKAAVL